MSAVAERIELPSRRTGAVALLATQLALAVVFCPRTAAAGDAGGFAAGGQAYRNNSRIAVAGSLLAVVQPRLHAVVVFDARPTPPQPLFALGRFGHQAGELVRPTGVAISAKRDLLFVSDTDNDRVVAFRLERDGRGQLHGATFAKAIGRHGEQPGELIQPAGLALSEDDEHLYVCDAGNARVQVFDAGLAATGQWGERGQGAGKFDTPVSVAVNATDGTIYVSDVGALNVQAFDRRGRFLYAWGAPAQPRQGLSPGEFGYPFGLAVTPGGTFVSDPRRQDVQVFHGSTLISRWGSPGSQDGQLFQPEGIAVIDGQRVAVIDLGGTRGQIFSPTGAFVASFPIPAGDLFPPLPPGS